MPSSHRARLRSPLASPLAAAFRAALTVTAQLTSPGPAGAEPMTAAQQKPVRGKFDQQILFKASRDPGYACFRIPAIVKTTKGTLLAFAEGRVLNCGDAADIDIVVKRSTDGGRTWSPLQVVNEGAGDTHGPGALSARRPPPRARRPSAPARLRRQLAGRERLAGNALAGNALAARAKLSRKVALYRPRFVTTTPRLPPATRPPPIPPGRTNTAAGAPSSNAASPGSPAIAADSATGVSGRTMPGSTTVLPPSTSAD